IILGYGPARAGDTTLLWLPPIGLRHSAGLLTLAAFVLLAASKLPRNHFRSWLRHPMLIGVALWALAHVLVNGFLHATVLFGGFLLWSVLCLLLSWKRPPAEASQAPSWGFTLAAVVLGAAVWAGFAFWAHVRLMGVAPFGTSWSGRSRGPGRGKIPGPGRRNSHGHRLGRRRRRRGPDRRDDEGRHQTGAQPAAVRSGSPRLRGVRGNHPRGPAQGAAGRAP